MDEEGKNTSKPAIHPTRKVFLDYWLSRPPEERISAVEYMRRQLYGDPGPMLKVARIVKRPLKVKQNETDPAPQPVDKDS